MDKSNPLASKICRRCEQERPAEQFGYYAKTKDRLKSWCNPCLNARQKERRAANLDAHRARDREWKRAKYAEDPTPFRARTKAAYEANREQHIEWMRAWREKYPERQQASERAWYEANREQAWASAAQRRARIAGATIGPIDPAALWTGYCAICSDPIDASLAYPDPFSKSVDHIHPLALGGSHEQSNLQWSHLRCNLRKGARLIG